MSREIMQQALDAFEDLKKSVTRDGTVSENWDAYYEKEYYALEALRQELAKPEQEPVAYLYHDASCAALANSLAHSTLLVLACDRKPSYRNETPLYTAPPRKPWVSLTDEDTANICMQSDINNWHDEQVIDAVEAKLKEKNNA